jgi:hypothetical protein
MDQMYYDTITKLENDGTDGEYINGWLSGYMHNPEREEQRVTDAYKAGYEDGSEKNTDRAGDFKA